ncbi:FecCD family ABC transporter permease [Pseudonocardia spinosispora]|uniref:FecCD family ABC transporter permease n=1 Tax=Pseudonocardia spinosispora TaxID=103441 RepID=UPI0004269393|nr:iron ABC transporter permease [Pseudonocardia spinosispora]
MRTLSTPGWVVVLAGALLVSFVLATMVGAVSLPLDLVLDTFRGHLTGSAGPGPGEFIVWELRAPRVLLGAAVGAGLAVAGLLVQAAVRNPLGDPYVLGLSAGASVGAVLVITSGVFLTLVTPLAAFVSTLLTAVVVYLLARVRGRLHAGRMIMAGVALGQLLGGVTSFLLLRTQDPGAQRQVLFWLLGSLAGAEWSVTVRTAVVVAALVAVAVVAAGRLNLLVLGDTAAAALGSDAGRLRALLLVVIALLTGTVVAASGGVGFIGLIVPNLTRLLVGADHRRVLPVCALLGALLVVWADTGARLVLAPTELPIGILTAAIGVPVFLYLLRRGETA